MTERDYTAAVERHLDMVYRIALNWFRQSADAEDAAQDVMLRLWRTDGACEIVQTAFPQFEYPEREEAAQGHITVRAHVEGYGEFQTERYVTPSGMDALLVLESSTSNAEAYFLHNGTLFTLYVKFSDSPLSTLRTILDAYE